MDTNDQWGAFGEEEVIKKPSDNAANHANDDDDPMNGVDLEDMLKYSDVQQVTSLLRSGKMTELLRQLSIYNGDEAKTKNAIPADDPEHTFVCDCSFMVLQLEVEKTKVHKFVHDHYRQRFPELAMLCSDGFTFTKAVALIQNSVDLTDVIAELDELFPSQITAIIIAAASTTQGRALSDDELSAVTNASQEMETLDAAKQMLLEYIQLRMPLICPNLCAFLGTGITSQLFAICGSVRKLAEYDPHELAKLGSVRHDQSGIPIKTSGFLSNSDLVANQPPQLRAKALRIVAASVVTLARIDFSRRASDNSQGLKQRQDVRTKMIQWTDPLIVRGAANNTYERRTRHRARFLARGGAPKLSSFQPAKRARDE